MNPKGQRSFIDSLCIGVLAVGLACGGPAPEQTEQQSISANHIQPWAENPSYWQYKGEPVLLLGGTDDDNPFQWTDEPLREQLDLLASVGGNYLRNTMSDRPDQGFEVYPFKQLPNGKYDLNDWNPEYWRRFERFLQWTAERDIIVQIELWDRFDHSRENWPPHPFNPKNNVNFTYEESGFDPEYPAHPGKNMQPFFFTTPTQRNNETVYPYQERFIDKLLAYSLKFGHILYCMDNETSGEPEWGRHWAEHIKRKAQQEGVSVAVTEMWDKWDIKADEHRRTFDHPELYDFVDVSQNNHNKGEQHWENAAWVHDYLAKAPRPINTVKTYGADANKFGHTDDDGIERFWRHILAGFASARFHRPPAGLGLGAKAQASLRAARKMESLVAAWDLSPAPDLLTDRDDNEAYAAVAAGAYVVYFTNGGSVSLEPAPGNYQVNWIDIQTGEWGGKSSLAGGAPISITAPANGHWLGVIVKQ